MKRKRSNMEIESHDLISEALARIINEVSRFSTNPEISKACYQLLVAANELLPLRDAKTLRKEDMHYLCSASDWADKGRNILSDLIVELHER